MRALRLVRTARLIPAAATLGASALVALAAAGCSSGSSGSAQPASGALKGTGAATATVSPVPTGLSAHLLTVGDLPAGWSVQTSATNPSMATQCPLLNQSVWNGPLPQRAETDLSAGLTGPYLVEQLAAGTSQDVDRAWQAFVAAIPKCTTYTHAGSSGSSTFTIAKADFPVYGSGSSGFSIAVQVSGGVSATGSIVVARTSDTVVLVYLLGVSGVPKDQVEQIVAKAVSKA